MRALLVMPLALALAACVVDSGMPNSSYDPTVYNASGGAATTAVAAAPVPPPPDCREVQLNVTIGGQAQRAHGQACRQSDGSWHFAN